MLPSVPSDPIEFFHQQFPDGALRSICRAIIAGHEAAHAYFKDQGFSEPQKHDALASLRRAHIERNTISVLGRHPEVAVTTPKNSAGNAYHNRIDAGLVFVTVSAVTTPGELVRDAAFRQAYADPNALSLFESAPQIEPGARLYGIVLHGPAEQPTNEGARAHARNVGLRFDRPAFIQVAFPDPELKRYMTEPIDLLKRFPGLLRDDDGNGTIPMPNAPLVPVPGVSSDA